VKAFTALAFLVPMAACAPKTPVTAFAAFRLDCRTPFADQSARIRAQPNLAPATHEPGEPYWFYSTEDGRASYVITEAGAPGHPAIVMQEAAAGGRMKTTGCAYGNKLGYQQLQTYVESLKGSARR
jgi:hypothetical protein